MQKNLKIIIGFVLAITLYSCKKDSNEVADSTILEYNRNLKKITSVLGKMHNEAVAVALNSKIPNSKILNLNARKLQSLFPSAPDPSTPTPSFYSAPDIIQAINSIYDYAESRPEFAGITSDIELPGPFVSSLITLIYTPTAGAIDSKLDSAVTVLKSNNLITQREAMMMTELQDIFVDGYALNMTQSVAGPYFSNKLNVLKNKYANITWNTNEGEIFLGTLEIAISSNEYWHANSQTLTPSGSASASNTSNLAVPPSTPLDPESPIVQVDLAAYALSWGWQVYNSWSDGTLDEKDQYKRIRTSLSAAMTASTMRLVKSYAVDITPDLFVNLDHSIGYGTVSLVHTFSAMELIPHPEDQVMPYCATLSNITDGTADPSVPIFLNNNQRFCTSNNFTTYVPDGYYQFDLTTNSYYQITNGKAIAIYQWMP